MGEEGNVAPTPSDNLSHSNSSSAADEDLLSRYENSLQQLCDPSRNNHIPFPPGFETKGRQGERLLGEIINRSETVLRYDDMALNLQNDWEPSSWTYTFRPQIHSGGRKGMGGRPAGTTVDVRRHFKSLLHSVISSRIIQISKDGVVQLNNLFDQNAIERLENIHSKGLSRLYNGYFAALPGNMLGVHAKFTQRDSPNSRGDGAEVMFANARDRHLLCLWIDRQGKARCSCIGKTIFSAKSAARQFDEPCCVHAEQMYSVFDTFLPPFAVNKAALRFKTLRNLAESISLSMESPNSFSGLNGTAAFVAFKDYPDRTTCGEQWVPIRVNPKRKGALTCAFCDTRSETNCAHILEWKRSKDLNMIDSQGTEYPEQGLSNDPGREWIDIDTDEEYGEDHLGRSYLPIGPINCPSSVQFDSALAQYVKVGNSGGSDQHPTTYLVQAPFNCQRCSCERDELTRKEFDEGVLTCTTGPLRMKVESFRCSNLRCGALIYEEGRSKHIVFHSFTSAATHVFMRREIQAVVLSAGTIANRFTNYFRNRLEDRYSGVLPEDAVIRGTRTLSDLFSLALKLMVLDPSPKLFSCSTCRVGSGNEFSVTCVDGIWAGYDRASTRPLVSISEQCEPIPSGRSTFHLSRPNTNILRSDAVARVLNSVINEEKPRVGEKNIIAAATALRFLEQDLVPQHWNVQPIFAKAQNGREAEELLSSFRQITFLLFKRDTMVYRLARAMQPHMIKMLHRLREQTRSRNDGAGKRKSGKMISEQDIFSEKNIVEKIIKLGASEGRVIPVQDLVGENKICWSDSVFAVSLEARSTICRLFMLILKGPLTQFILASEVSSLKEVSHILSTSGDTQLIRLQLLQMHSHESLNIIKTNRFLMAALLSALELQECTPGTNPGFVKAIGNILQAVAEVVSTFYESYRMFPQAEASALVYQRRWEWTSSRIFRTYLMRNESVKRQSKGHNDVFKSGSFFPNHPQVRPMPFNDRVDFCGRHRDYGACSKHYDSQRPDFTPGAITFCCACSHPIIFGFKTLERGEGPRAVLDVLISRFPTLPRFVVYDFACGLLRSAQHTLWWATKNTTFVSDRFHVDNHTCHRGFHPDSYNYLNGRNTVSHEQRNRPIANLKESLRNCSQELYVSLLAYHSLYLNLKAKIRQKKAQMKGQKGTSIAKISNSKRRRSEYEKELSDEEIQAWYFDVMKFTCPCCPGRNHGNVGSSDVASLDAGTS